MPLQFHKLRDVRHLLPFGTHCIVDEAMHATDEVHQFVRVMSTFEYIIKLVSASIHGAVSASHPGDQYDAVLSKSFLEVTPSLGHWLNSASAIRQRLSTHWLSEVTNTVWERRPCRPDVTESDTSKMRRVIGASRRFLNEISKTTQYSIFEAFEDIVKVRNAFSHGAITVRFARQFGQPIIDALAEIVATLKLAERWDVVVPLERDRGRSDSVVVLDCENYGAAGGECRPRTLALGDVTLQWGKLYLLPANANSMELGIVIDPLIRYERSHRDFQVFNAYDSKLRVAEYLSYRSGDFDFDPEFDAWITSLAPTKRVSGMSAQLEDPELIAAGADVSLVEDSEISDSVGATSGVGRPIGNAAEDGAYVLSLVTILRDGDKERSLRRCRERFRDAVDGLDSSTQQLVLRRIIETNDTLPDEESVSHRVVGSVCRDFGFYDLACIELKKASDANPSDRYTKQGLAHSLLQYGISEKQSGKDTSESSRFEHGRQLIGQAKEALVECLEPAAASGSEVRHNVRALSMLVDAHCRLGEFQDALVRCEEGLKLEPTNSRLLSQQEFLIATVGRS